MSDPTATAQAAYWQDRSDRLAGELIVAEAERDRLRAAIEPLRPYRVAIRAGLFEGSGVLADAILGAVAALGVEGQA